MQAYGSREAAAEHLRRQIEAQDNAPAETKTPGATKRMRETLQELEGDYGDEDLFRYSTDLTAAARAANMTYNPETRTLVMPAGRTEANIPRHAGRVQSELRRMGYGVEREGDRLTVRGDGDAVAVRVARYGEAARYSTTDDAEHRKFLEGEPVVRLTGEEFPKGDGDLATRVADWYKDKGKELVENNTLGKVLLGRNNVEESIGHGPTRCGSLRRSCGG